MLTVIGDLLADVVVLGASTLEVGTDNPAVITHTRGGSAANVAAAAARETPTRFIGRVGADAEGDALARALAECGVDVRVQRAGRTGSIVILVDDTAERTMLTDRGAAAELESIENAWLEGSSRLHLPLYGFVGEASRRALLEACRWAHARAIPVSLDLSSVAAMRDLGVDVLGGLLRQVAPDVAFANADEARLLEEVGLRHPGRSVLVVKRGPDPVLLVTTTGTAEVPVEPIGNVVDTTGAGDAFAAGYLAAALAGKTPDQCATAGARSAREALRRPGAI
ncbi:carbohydrate kinase family protein [Microbacterium sp. BK668]|uniref:carbohydrate kinase family protein n=1 Tax=Microbacterium sp. BK668 TaxID=2512118 RepID=UPI00105E0352|nr:carbohydrate kinase family protein [Microbacterium sp. BK668]TDN92994.1 sugar/nucleoside kinase (ribokinase family) [Microbacterium sp. BK668]